MSNIPSGLVDFPFYGLDGPNQVYPIQELLRVDPYSNYSCVCCGKSIIVQEGIIEGSEDAAYLVCQFCFSILGILTGPLTIENINQVYEVEGKIANKAINPELSDSEGYPWI